MTAEVIIRATYEIGDGAWKVEVINRRTGVKTLAYAPDRQVATSIAFEMAREKWDLEMGEIERRVARIAPMVDETLGPPQPIPHPQEYPALPAGAGDTPLCQFCRQPETSPPDGPWCCAQARMWRTGK